MELSRDTNNYFVLTRILSQCGLLLFLSVGCLGLTLGAALSLDVAREKGKQKRKLPRARDFVCIVFCEFSHLICHVNYLPQLRNLPQVCALTLKLNGQGIVVKGAHDGVVLDNVLTVCAQMQEHELAIALHLSFSELRRNAAAK